MRETFTQTGNYFCAIIMPTLMHFLKALIWKGARAANAKIWLIVALHLHYFYIISKNLKTIVSVHLQQ